MTRLTKQQAQVLAFIHSRLYVHCDIKASNVRLMEDGTIKLMDFGLAARQDEAFRDVLRGETEARLRSRIQRVDRRRTAEATRLSPLPRGQDSGRVCGKRSGGKAESARSSATG